MLSAHFPEDSPARVQDSWQKPCPPKRDGPGFTGPAVNVKLSYKSVTAKSVTGL